MKTILGIVIASLFLAGMASAQEFGPWSQPFNLGPAVNTSFGDAHPSLSKDGLSLYFSSMRPGAGGIDLWVTERDSLDSPWQAPQNVTMLNSPYDDHAANLTIDGHWLFFFSTRPGGCNAGERTELWAAHRQNKGDDFGWDPPINLGCTLNAPGTDQGAPGHWEDDTAGIHYLYFARNYTPANSQGFVIYLSTCSGDLGDCNRQQLWSTPDYVAELSSPGFRTTKTGIRHRDGLEMIIASTRPGTVGGHDLWVSTRPSAQDPWSIPINLNLDNQDKCFLLGIGPGSCPAINTVSQESAAALSWDGQTMFFYSDRPGGLGGNDLYISTRQKLLGRR